MPEAADFRHSAAGAYTNAVQVAADLTGIAETVGVRLAALVRHYGVLMETQIKANASGRPGPRVITGDYRRSWTTVFETSATVSRAIIGTDRPQARRLEYGFVGADRTGRVFNQPPYAHVGPAMAKIGPEFEAAVGGIIP